MSPPAHPHALVSVVEPSSPPRGGDRCGGSYEADRAAIPKSGGARRTRFTRWTERQRAPGSLVWSDLRV